MCSIFSRLLFIELHVTDALASQESLLPSVVLFDGHPLWDYFIDWDTILFVEDIQINTPSIIQIFIIGIMIIFP